ncbi:hypothetical protein [Pseudomonas sp. B392_1p]|uniref:hypothetical protein n=1 Tax=Pseudomonas sp. B392_1p TaxID=3457507 RepID=UPI003FD182B1
MTETPPESEAPEQEAQPQVHPWANLAPVPHRLLRLFPQPVDRATGVRPLRFAQYSRLERNSPKESLLRLRVDLPGQSVRNGHNQLDVWVDHVQKEVRFAPDAGLQMDPPNRGLGRFLLAQGIDWAQGKWAHYQVQGGDLPNKNLLSEDARLRRDHALRGQGFEVVYPDEGQLKAHFDAPRLSNLLTDWNPEKVQVIDTLDAASMLEQADQQMRDQDAILRKQEERITWLKREDSGLRFTVTCLVAFALFQAGLLIWIATR